MRVADVWPGVRTLFLDTAPVIYYVEGIARYADVMREVFLRIDAGGVSAVTSPVTLAECVVHPLRLNLPDLNQHFLDVVLYGKNTSFIQTSSEIAQSAAKLRANYAFTLTDALQLATATASGCDIFLTNDVRLKRVSEIRVIVVDELTL